MRRESKYIVTIVGVLFLALLAFGASTNFSQLDVDGNIDVSGTVDATEAYEVGSSDIIKTMIFPLDSLGSGGRTTPYYFTLERGIVVKRADVCLAVVADSLWTDGSQSDTVTVKFRSGSSQDMSVLCRDYTQDSLLTWSQTTDVEFTAASVCSVVVTPADSAYGGVSAAFILQYTDN